MFETAPKEADLNIDAAKLYGRISSFEERINNVEDALSSLEESLGASANLLETLVEFKAYAQDKIKAGGSESLEGIQREIGELKSRMGGPVQAIDSEKFRALNERIQRMESTQGDLRKKLESTDLHSVQEYVNNLENSILKVVDSQERLQQKIDGSNIKELKELLLKNNPEKTAEELRTLKASLASRPAGGGDDVRLLQNEILQLRNHQARVMHELEEMKTRPARVATDPTGKYGTEGRVDADKLADAAATKAYDKLYVDMNMLKNNLTTEIANLRTSTEGQISKLGGSMKNLNDIIVGKIKLMDGKIDANAEATGNVSKSMRTEMDALKQNAPTGADPERTKDIENRVAEDRILIGKMTVLIKRLQEAHNPAKLNETRARVENIEKAIAAKEAGRQEVAERVAALEQQIAKIDVGRIMSLIEKIETIKNEISSIGTRMSPEKNGARLNELEGKIANIEARMKGHDEIHETVQDLNVKLAVMNDHMKTIKEEVAKKKPDQTRERGYLILE